MSEQEQSEREALAKLLDEQFGNWQGDSMAPGMSAGAYVAPMILAAGFRRPQPVTDAEVEAAMRSWFNSTGSYDLASEAIKDRNRPRMRASLEAARKVEPPTAEVKAENYSVLVEGSWIPVKEWPKILGNFMRDNDALGREAKGYAAEIDRLTKERLHAELHREEERRSASLPLDPEPWLCSDRYCTAPGLHRGAKVDFLRDEANFKPGEGYEQDRARYEWNTDV